MSGDRSRGSDPGRGAEADSEQPSQSRPPAASFRQAADADGVNADRFSSHAMDIDRRLDSALHDNAKRRAALLSNLAGGNTQDFLGRLADVSPLLTGGYAGGASAHQFDRYLLHAAGGRMPTHPYTDMGMGGGAGAGAGGGIGAGGGGGTGLLTTAEQVERHVQAAVAREMRNQEDRVVELIAREWDRRAQELEHALRGRFTDLQVLHESSTRLLREVGASVAALKAETKAESDRLDVAVSNLAQELRGKLADQNRHMSRELQAVRETALEVQSRFSVDTAEYSRRVESMQRRATEAYADAMNTVESRVSALKTENEASVRELRKSMQQDVDQAGRVAADCRSVVRRGDDELRRLGAKVADLMEDAGVRRSELRSLREDVRQMELYVKGRIDRVAVSVAKGAAGGTPGPLLVAAAHAARGGDHRRRDQVDEHDDGARHQQTQLVSALEITRLQSDVYALKQSVAYLSSRLKAYGMLEDDDDIVDIVTPKKSAAHASDRHFQEPTMLGVSAMTADAYPSRHAGNVARAGGGRDSTPARSAGGNRSTFAAAAPQHDAAGSDGSSPHDGALAQDDLRTSYLSQDPFDTRHQSRVYGSDDDADSNAKLARSNID
jgi:hypothetical protein